METITLNLNFADATKKDEFLNYFATAEGYKETNLDGTPNTETKLQFWRRKSKENMKSSARRGVAMSTVIDIG